jgi:hypothetical protein
MRSSSGLFPASHETRARPGAPQDRHRRESIPGVSELFRPSDGGQGDGQITNQRVGARGEGAQLMLSIGVPPSQAAGSCYSMSQLGVYLANQIAVTQMRFPTAMVRQNPLRRLGVGEEGSNPAAWLARDTRIESNGS